MTTTVIEAYDAQMLDYQNDHDVQMHMSSSDSWLHDVTPMEDDGQLAFQSKGTAADSTPTIEVDMEAYVDDGHIEYEMADDNHGHNSTSGELLDVDLLDASAVQSPSVPVALLPTTPSVEYSQAQLAARISEASDLSASSLAPIPLGPSTVVAGSTTAALEIPENHNVAGSQAHVTPPVDGPPSERASLSEHAAYHINESGEQVVIPEDRFSDEASEYRDTARQITAAQSVADLHPATKAGATSDAASILPTTIEDRGELDHFDSDRKTSQFDSVGNTETPVIYHNSAVEPRASVEEVETHSPDVAHVGESDTHSEQEPVVVPAPPKNSWEAAQENQIEGDTLSIIRNTDQPTEVSNAEESYLEAPPSILLSIFSTDHPELCLFNKPFDPLPNEDDAQERHILLQQAPTLYYEPLDQVFEALRQDEYVSTVLEVTGNELALEAYELDLAITEDNIYAREISLHDIRVLHDSANLGGPLRLRLFISGPRFIVRYHMLQQGIIKLHAEEVQVPEHEETEHSETHEPHEDSEHTQHCTSAETSVALEQLQLQFERLEDTEGQQESEHTDEDYETSYDEAEGTLSHTGEIDLSTLPPFVDSPDPSGEGEHIENDENADLGHGEVAIAEDIATEGDQVEEDPDTENHESPRQEGTLETDTNEGSMIGAEQIVHDPHESFDEEHASLLVPPSNHHNPGETPDGLGRSGTQESKTPQAEPTEITDGTHPEDTNEEQHETEGEAVDDQIVGAQTDSTDIEELKDFEGELGETWDDELDGEGDPDTTWEAEQENDEQLSNESSVTLSSKASKRSFDEYEFEHSDDVNPTSGSPGTKRPRVV